MKKLMFFSLSSLVVCNVYADGLIERDPTQTEINASPTIKQSVIEKELLRKQQLSSDPSNSEQHSVINYTGRQLVENPEILEDLFLKALITADQRLITGYSKLYKLVPTADPALFEWAEAILLREQDLNKSVSAYRALMAKLPDNDFIRFQLAETLFYNQQYSAAKNQFERLRASSTTTEQDKAVFDRFIQAINAKGDWNFSFGATFLNDHNLGNTAKEGTEMPLGSGVLKTQKREQGKGISAWFGATKQWNLREGKYLILNSSLANKYYWDNKGYNDVNANFGFGIGYSDARFSFEFVPNLYKRWYAGGSNATSLKEYSNTYGASISLGYWLNRNFKYSGYYSFGYDKYDRERYSKQYNGANHTLSNSLLYLPSATQYWSLSLDASKKYATDRSNAYNRLGVRLTWGKEWPFGISTATTLSIAKRHYQQASFLSPNKQKNNEYSASVSLWHKQVHFLGLTPKVTWSYTKTKSNLPIYSYDKHQVFVDVSKSF